MSCNNCYGGCSEITSDRCVRYTGVDISSLGIETGDSLSDITKSLTDFLLSVIPGTAIKPVIQEGIICELVTGYLPVCGDLTIVDFVIALIKSVCDLQEQVTVNTDAITTLNTDYDVDCLTGVVVSSDTHLILQAVITKLCEVDTDLTALANHLVAFYSSDGAELDAYIANYLSTHSSGSTFMSNKMVPYVAYPYFGSLAGKFGAEGVGINGTDWEKIYLCNGYNGLTPDLRGRVPVGDTNMLNSASPDAVVDPTIAGNPTYTATPGAWTKNGANLINLNNTQVPIHTHVAIGTASQPSHDHYTFNINNSGIGPLTSTLYPQSSNTWNAGSPFNYEMGGSVTVPSIGKSSPAIPTITIDSITVTPTTGGISNSLGYGHPNVQPGIASYYIMYLP